jgi:exopolyphosphatase/guanosine-5'-triphosphate,3'-diphosphate pyrophosphatase
VAEFAAEARALGAVRVRVIATSAARDAENPEDLTAAVKSAADLNVEIISGDQEAELTFQGVTSAPHLAGKRLLIMDLGGGSTEFILGASGHKQFSRSYKLGCVRLLEKLRPPETPSTDDLRTCRQQVRSFLATHVCPDLEPLLKQHPVPPLLAGTGGTATILARIQGQITNFDRARVESTMLDLNAAHRWVKRLWSLPLPERQQVPGLPANRADVILMGVVIYEQVMDFFGLPQLCISTRGLRFAAVR